MTACREWVTYVNRKCYCMKPGRHAGRHESEFAIGLTDADFHVQTRVDWK